VALFGKGKDFGLRKRFFQEIETKEPNLLKPLPLSGRYTEKIKPFYDKRGKGGGEESRLQHFPNPRKPVV